MYATVNLVKNFVETTEKKPTPLTSIPQERRTIAQLSEEFHREIRSGRRAARVDQDLEIRLYFKFTFALMRECPCANPES